MSCRVEVDTAGTTTWVYEYNEENRLEKIRQVTGTCSTPGTDAQYWTFTYDGDGLRVKEDYYNGTTTVTTLYYAFGMYEVTDPSGANTITRYYSLGGMTAKYDSTDLEYMLTDLQGSTIAVLDDAGAMVANSEKRYLPFGDIRTDLGTSNQTDFGYTGQREIEGSELMDYNARFLNPGLARFTQPDTIIPNPANPQSLNRYSYVGNNPINFVDPTGHDEECDKYAEDDPRYCDNLENDLDCDLDIEQAGCEDEFAELIALLAEIAITMVCDICDIAFTLARWSQGEFSWWDLGAFLPVVSGSIGKVDDVAGLLGKYSDEILEFTRRSDDIDEFGKLKPKPGFERHHIVERRFARGLDKKPNEMLSTYVDKKTHQGFTNEWRKQIGYNNGTNALRTDIASADDIWGAAQVVYKEHADLLAAAKWTIFGK